MRERPDRAGSRGRWKVSIVVASAFGVLGSLFVGASILVDRWTRATAWDQCERSDLDLVRAAGAGDLEVVRNELDDGHDPDQQDQHANTALGCAIPRHRTEVVMALLEAGADADRPSGSNPYDDVPIELAYQEQDGEVLAALLDHGADPDRTTDVDRPVMAQALHAKDDATLALLLEHGADPSVQGSTRPLVVAVTVGTDASVAALLAHGADPDGVPGDRPIVAAVGTRRAGAVSQLLAAPVDLSLPSSDLDATPVGTAALAAAAGLGDVALVDVFLGLGADPDAAATNGPLLRATTFGHTDVVRRLLDAGADPNAGFTDSLTLGFTLALVDPALAERLGVAGSLPDPVTMPPGPASPGAAPDVALAPIMVPPLAAGAATGRPEIVELLLDHGADPNQLADGRFSPLYLAAATCDVRAVDLLLGAGADPSAAPADRLPSSVACAEVAVLVGA